LLDLKVDAKYLQEMQFFAYSQLTLISAEVGKCEEGDAHGVWQVSVQTDILYSSQLHCWHYKKYYI